MKFAPRGKIPTLEERLALWSAYCIGNSIAFIVFLFASAFTIATKSIAGIAITTFCLTIYCTLIYYLVTIGRHTPKNRLKIWQTSMIGHIIILMAVYYFVGDFLIALVFLIPEAISGALHLIGLYHSYSENKIA